MHRLSSNSKYFEFAKLHFSKALFQSYHELCVTRSEDNTLMVEQLKVSQGIETYNHSFQNRTQIHVQNRIQNCHNRVKEPFVSLLVSWVK